MLALTIQQPWAWAVGRGIKNVENRTWVHSYRGPLAVHAASRWDPDCDGALRTVVHIARAQGVTLPATLRDDLPYSGTRHVIAVVDLVDICTKGMDGSPCGCGPWAMPGQAHWQLANARVLPEPVPARGRLGLWQVDLGPAEGGEDR